MVISFVSSGTSARATSGNVTPGLPSGWATNDIFICIIISSDNVNSTMPVGWTAIDDGTNNGTGEEHGWGVIRTSVFYRRAITGDTNPLITHPNGNNIVASISAYRGVITSGSPLDVVGTTTVNSSYYGSTTVRANSITTLTDGACVIFTGGIGSRSTFSSFSGIPTPTERVDTPNQSGYPSEFLADFLLNTADATDNRTCVATTSGYNNGLMFALKPIPITSTIICITDPSDANIYIDGILQGTNTSSSFLIQAGTHTITFTKAGYLSYTQIVIVTTIANQTITVAAILQPISNIIDYGIVICTTSAISSCPITPILCPIQITPLNYVNFIATISSTQIMTITIRFLYSINDIQNYTDVIRTLAIGTNIIYAFPTNVRYSPNAIISLDSVTLI